MINCKFDNTDPLWVALVHQVARLEQLWGFPKGAEAKRELCLALANCDSIKEAEFIIDLYIKSETTERCPTPPDLRARIAAEHARTAPDPLEEQERMWRSTFRDGTRPEREKALNEHKRILDLRRHELATYPGLNRQEYDPDFVAPNCQACSTRVAAVPGDMRKLRTPLRDKLEKLTAQLRAADWR